MQILGRRQKARGNGTPRWCAQPVTPNKKDSFLKAPDTAHLLLSHAKKDSFFEGSEHRHRSPVAPTLRASTGRPTGHPDRPRRPAQARLRLAMRNAWFHFGATAAKGPWQLHPDMVRSWCESMPSRIPIGRLRHGAPVVVPCKKEHFGLRRPTPRALTGRPTGHPAGLWRPAKARLRPDRRHSRRAHAIPRRPPPQSPTPRPRAMASRPRPNPKNASFFQRPRHRRSGMANLDRARHKCALGAIPAVAS